MSRKNNKDVEKFLTSTENIKSFEKTIDIHPSFLDYKILDTVKTRIFSTYINSCSEDGVIINIKEILKISNIISKDCCSVLFNVKFDALTVKPETGYKITFNPTKIINKGLFGKLYGNSINIFIQAPHSWQFNEDEESFCIKISKKSTKIVKSSNVVAKIIAIKFDFNNFSPRYNCICDFLTVE